MKSESNQSAKSLSRRDFMRNAATTAAGVATGASAIKTAQASPYKRILPQSVLGANETILTGHIGTGGMGRSDMRFTLMRDDLEPIAVCDLWKEHMLMASDMVESKFGEFPLEYHDYRKLIENKDIDAVVIATPDHWHTLPAITALDAGKHVYCEKPLATSIMECHAVKKAVERNKQVFQAGNMQRSGTTFQEAVAMIQDGYIGDVARVECWIHDNELLAGMGDGNSPMPEGCDWEFHQGWTERVPFNNNRWIYNFRWFLEYSGGKITDWGAHLIDVALWAMGEDKQVRSVSAQGGNYLIQDNRTTPDTLEVVWKYDDYILSFSNRVYNGGPKDMYFGHGIMFHGTKGSMKLSRNGYEIYNCAPNGEVEEKRMDGTGSLMNVNHWENFVNAIKTGEKTRSNIDVIYNTTMTCHMGTCAYVADAKLSYNYQTQKFEGGDSEAVKKANEFAYRPYNNGWELPKA